MTRQTGGLGGSAVERRTVLQLGALAIVGSATAALTGCGSVRARPDRPAAATPSGTSRTHTVDQGDLALTVNALADEEALLSVYAAAVRRTGRPALPRESVAQQALRVSRVRAALVNYRSPVTVDRRPIPAKHAAVRRRLEADTRAAAAGRGADCTLASTGGVAALFASLAAAHLQTLRGLGAEVPAQHVDLPRRVEDLAPVQRCLAAEQAAVFGYGVLGGVLYAGVRKTADARRAVAGYDRHRLRRDALEDLVVRSGAPPDPAEPFYETPFRVDDARRARRLAEVLERRCTATYLTAVGDSTSALRAAAAAVVSECAVAALAWGGAPQALPGLPNNA